MFSWMKRCCKAILMFEFCAWMWIMFMIVCKLCESELQIMWDWVTVELNQCCFSQNSLKRLWNFYIFSCHGFKLLLCGFEWVIKAPLCCLFLYWFMSHWTCRFTHEFKIIKDVWENHLETRDVVMKCDFENTVYDSGLMITLCKWRHKWRISDL